MTQNTELIAQVMIRSWSVHHTKLSAHKTEPSAHNTELVNIRTTCDDTELSTHAEYRV